MDSSELLLLHVGLHFAQQLIQFDFTQLAFQVNYTGVPSQFPQFFLTGQLQWSIHTKVWNTCPMSADGLEEILPVFLHVLTLILE